MIYERYREITYDRQGNVTQQTQQFNQYPRTHKYNFNSLQTSSNHPALPQNDPTSTPPSRPIFKLVLVIIAALVIIVSCLIFGAAPPQPQQQNEKSNVPGQASQVEKVGMEN